MADDGAIETTLASLGFTEMEARLYCDLLRHGPASGYRLAQRTGKAAANTYQTLGTLSQKGAVIFSDEGGDKKVYSPFPPRQLLNMLRRQFELRHDTALTGLEALHEPKSDERVYSIGTVAQVLERARTMLEQATEIVLFDFFPQIYDLLREEVDAVRARGVTVAGIAYEERHAVRDMPLNRESTELVGSRWPGLGLILIVDASQHLIAQLSKDMQRVLNAVWTDSVFISCVFHSAVAADIRLVALRADPSDPLRKLSLQGAAPIGLKRMLESDRR
ncbi:hypothetical protein ASE90_10860 [Sphingomonas sp. Leaf67]|uniref:TrmB family transcriptional regulator n=1 Tax=unclassified Sphingomonas TaxID=196159 RepID=UPI0006F4DA29|nr:MULTISPECIES: helix-turn-helix domain-containing protein [unclassified Sphingomonas]KQN79969.1 hypothetical protein ASE91_12015 [Sphingomonas sp. Leaf62]KQN82182.1 hypothetical protein ASE90_10860 [Sphingomonas sp. Leaf67]